MKIICLGDSFTQGYLVEDKNYTRFLEKAGFLVRNLGVNGSTTEEILERYQRFKGVNKEDTLIIFAGTNDFLNAISVEFAYQNLKRILNMRKLEKTIIVIPPYIEEEASYIFYKEVNMKIDYLAEKLGKLRKNKYFILIDARRISGRYIDGIHLARDFHKKLAEEILGEIND